MIRYPTRFTVEKIVRRIVHQLETERLSKPDCETPLLEATFRSPVAEALKREIVSNGKKLWERHYVDGNGGNISCRLTKDQILCTPTMCSKGDLTVDDLCLVDLEGNTLMGEKPRTSEILLHLEIYKTVPAAGAVIHCHPPHATAYAITGRVPPNDIIPEHEVFVGPVALAPYGTPGTKAFAETVVPFVKDHNTIFLANHGVVCWADSVTHAEWCVEVVDTYCRTLMLAAQLGGPLTRIPAHKIEGLLEIKKRLGLPDARLSSETIPAFKEPRLADVETPAERWPQNGGNGSSNSQEWEPMIQAITDQVMATLCNPTITS